MKNFLFILLQHLLPQHLLSRLAGRLADCQTPWLKDRLIRWFAKHYRVDMSEAATEQLTAYASFNDFFTRALKPDARPIAADEQQIVSPADGAISQLGAIDHQRIFQAKGISYGLTALLGGDTDLAKLFQNGHFATVYLSPRDYHRVHMPITGTLRSSLYIPGDLFSVNQTTCADVDQLFARNERLVCLFDTAIGPMALVLVGALIVAGIETVWSDQVAPQQRRIIRHDYLQQPQPLTLAKGAEMGRFKLGSTVIMLFGADAINWLDTLQAGSPLQMGSAIAHTKHTQDTREGATP